MLSTTNDSIPEKIRRELDNIRRVVVQEYVDDRSRDDSTTIAALLEFFQTFSDDEMDHAIIETKGSVISDRSPTLHNLTSLLQEKKRIRCPN